MARSVWGRIGSLLLGLWFAVVSAGPGITHMCPAHGGLPPQAGMARAGHDAMHTNGAAQSDGSVPHDEHQCTCVGDCCSSTPPALGSPGASVVDAESCATRDGGLPVYVHVRVATEHLLPFAHAPPLSL